MCTISRQLKRAQQDEIARCVSVLFLIYNEMISTPSLYVRLLFIRAPHHTMLPTITLVTTSIFIKQNNEMNNFITSEVEREIEKRQLPHLMVTKYSHLQYNLQRDRIRIYIKNTIGIHLLSAHPRVSLFNHNVSISSSNT